MVTTALATVAFLGLASASTNCKDSLTGSTFEIDPTSVLPGGANLVVNNTAAADNCIDWLTGGTGTGFRSTVTAKNDTPSGGTDESFGQGTSEDDGNPTVVDGSIPPNKSDLKAFGLNTEAGTIDPVNNPTGKFLQLFWSRVQNPSGTTNMDFELNQKTCDENFQNPGTPSSDPDCANNGTLPKNAPANAGKVQFITPIRTAGDKLITYDLSKGGTVPTISIRSWIDTNGTPDSADHWGDPTVISGGQNAQAAGSVNTGTLPANQTGGATQGLTTALGQQDPFTFGEASITFKALFGGIQCGKFGSAYLKSRSSDSFTSEIKDFVPPKSVQLSNCTGLTTSATQSATLGNPISDTATLSGATSDATGTVTFKLYGPFTGNDPSTDTCVDSGTGANLVTTLGPVNIGSPDATTGNYTISSGNYTPTAVGRYQWVASYSGDSKNVAATTKCGDANEASVVTQQPSKITTAQKWVPNDTATIDHGGGKVTFTLLKNVSQADCLTTPQGGYPAGSVIYGPVDVSVPTTAPFEASTNNTTAVTAVGANGDTYRWKAVYTPDATDTGHRAVTSCVESTAFSSLDNGGQVSSS
jgi:hypothetical protein